MDDLISRQAIIDMLQSQAYDDWNQGASTTWANAFSKCAEMIRNLPSAEPSVSDCWGCKCQKMERLKEQKTFSEMVHLHDAKRTAEQTTEQT